MPLSNVFRHSFPNPFHNSSRKNRHAHARSGSTNGSSTSIVVVPVVEGNNNNTSNNTIDINKPLPSIFGRSDSRKMFGLRKRDKSKSKDKDDDDKKKRQGSQATSKSNHSSLSARHLERLDPDATTPLPRPSSPSDLISHLQISKALPPPPPPPSLQEQHMSDISSPASTSFSPSPLSPQIRMPATPSAPSTPTSSAPTPHSARLLSASPEPLTPTPGNSPGSPMATSSPGKIRSRFGSLFFNKSRQHSFDERVLSEQEEIDAREKENADLVAVLKKKRMSTGSLQIPIGAFLSNTFRTKQQQQQQLQQVQDQDQSQQQQQQPKKRRGLLPKLPKLDTRPRIVISKSAAKKQKEAKRSATGNGDETHVPPGNSTATAGHEHAPSPGLDVVPGSLTKSGGGGSKSSSSLLGSPALLSPFYLPPQIRTGERNDDPMATTATAKGSQAGQQLLDVSFNPTFDWHQDTQVFYDDRWDRASVRTVDTEIIRLSDNPNFPGYPERNDYWQQHCRIRERRWKHQIQKHQQQQLTESRSPRWMSGGGKADPVTGLLDEDSGSLLEEEDEYDEDGEPLSARLRGVTDLLHSLPERRTRQSTAPQSSEQNRFRQRRVRYTTYSAYIAAMQVKSKNRTDHKRSLDVAAIAAPHDGSDSDKLMTDVRTLRERSMVQPASVKDTADMFEEAFMGDSSVTDHSLDPAQRRHVQRRNGTNLGSSDDESEGQLETRNRVRPMLMPKTLQRQSQPDSGILFVTAAATTAEVYPTLVHDPRDQLMTKSAKSSAYKNNNHTSTTATSPIWIEDGCDEGMIGSLVASYFDKRVLEALDNGKCSENGCDGNGGCGDGCCVGYGGGGLGGVGNGFMMMQSSFGDQGSLDAHNGPEPDPSGSSRPDDNNDRAGNNHTHNDNHNDLDDDDNIPNITNKNIKNINDSSTKDLCLSRPGQYASHNHIMPLEQLLEMEEQERRRRRLLQQKQQQQEIDRQLKQKMMTIYPPDDDALDATKPTTTSITTTATATTAPSTSTTNDSSLMPSTSLNPSQSSPSNSRSTTPSSSQPLGSNSNGGDTFLADPSTATSLPSTTTTTPSSLQTGSGSAYPDQQPPPSPQQPQKQSSGYMLLVLDRGRCQYYENGTRKRGPQWDPHVEEVCSHGPGGEDNSNQVGQDMMTTTATTATTTTRTDVIEEGEEELDEEELAWMEQQRQRHSFSPDLKRPERGKSKIDGDSSRVHSVDGESAPAAPAPEGAAVGAVQEQGQVQVQEVDPLGSLAVIDSPLSPRFTAAFSESPTINPSSSQVFPLPSRGASTSSTSTALAPARPHYMVVSSSSTSSYTNPPSRLASANGLSNLSRIRGAKSRPSLSYSVLPTLSTSSYASSTLLTTPPSASISTSTSATTLISSTPSNLLNNPPTLRHQTSGSITPTSTLYSGGGTPPAAPSSPQAATAQSSSSSSSTLLPSRKLSWSDLPSQPTSATALLRDALSKPAPAPILSDGASTTSTTTSTMTDPAQRLKDQWAQKLRSQSVIFKSSSSLSSPASMMAARSRSMLLSPPLLPALASKRWMRNSSAHLLSPPQPHPGALDPKSRQPPPLQPVVQAQKQQSRQDTLSEGDLETEADQEMEEELRHLVDDDSTVTTFKAEQQQQQQSKKSPLTTRRTKRAMSMVELSASTSASQFKAAVSATRQRYKAEPSISTSTMAILQSEGMYHWNEFFDV
ncbi:hypothetical protein BGX33_001539 [Mortierella sp. NVP41]|nr:hypothetical protein BGX33_001539 [Mortierella sp. NVP41]